ncbi:T9SS type B sorting domain-containing protein [Flavobacterium sp.]
MRRLIKKFVVLSALCFFVDVTAQYDSLWYFGIRAGLDFTSGSPMPISDSQLVTYEGTSTVCDNNGQLLFYTNGVRVLNRNHQLMPNGNFLAGGTSTTQSALIIPNTTNPARYYIFTADEFAGPDGISYSEVDMTADNGLGDVLVKNVQLLARSCEKLAACPHPNGVDVWVIGHEWNSNAFYAWKVGGDGISAPIISNAGILLTGLPPFIQSAGQMKISPDGTRLVMANIDLDSQLFDFDANTGVVSNPVTLMNGSAFGAEFSPSGNALYVTDISNTGTRDFRIMQFNLDAADIPASSIQVGDSDASIGLMALGPDSKIYIANYGETRISSIQNPDVIGNDCNVSLLSTSLGVRTTFYGLPVLYQPGFYVTDINSEEACVGTVIDFSVDTRLQPESINWDFGDGTFSNQMEPSHSYQLPGTYTVKVSVRRNGYERYFSELVDVFPNPTANQPPDMELCDDDSDGQEVFDLYSQNRIILGTQSPLKHVVTYHLTRDDAIGGLNPLPRNYTNISNPQPIFVRVTSVARCYAVTVFFIRTVPKPVVDMPLEYWICSGNSVTLTAPSGFSNYLWSTSETTRSITVTQPGNYTLTVTESGTNINCQTSINIIVREANIPIIRDTEIKDWTDNDNSINVRMESPGDYLYSIDGINYQQSPFFYGLLPGLYTVYAKNDCGIDTEEVAILMYPRFFTPNGDGYNDFWTIRYAHFEPDMQVHIFDRYGKVLTFFNPGESSWDGFYNGKQLPSTDYWFVVKRNNGREYNGHFSMLR